MIKKKSNKNLVISSEDEERFQLSNKCWIPDKLFDVGGDKVRDNCHVMKVLHIRVIMLSLNWQKKFL